tara:strand:+ start:1118 stop:1339 length:222 start_codon:yes stop_codon:yes gene_type:complete
MTIEQQAAIAVMRQLARSCNPVVGEKHTLREKSYYELVVTETEEVLFSHRSSTPVAREFVKYEGAQETLDRFD